jgi:signal transduction histidine kinase
MISDILFSGKRLHRTVNNLLFFAQLEVTDPVKQREEAGLSFETHAEFFLPDKIRQLSLLHERETDLLMEFSIGVIAVPPDYSAKIIEELVDNAFKYSQKGNPVVVKTTINNDKYIITIADKGRGMTLDQIKNIGAYMQFDRQFYEQQGSGLGLAIAKRCCELFSGVLTLTPNADGAGITAEVQLPLLSEQPMMEY